MSASLPYCVHQRVQRRYRLAAEAATSVEWMLPSTQNAGFSAAGPGRGVGDRQHPDVAALVALADRFDRRRARDARARAPCRISVSSA